MKQVVAALILQNGKLLIGQRTEHQPLPLKWEFPGGKIEPGEQPTEALRRELEEELGIHAVIGDELSRVRHTYKSGGTIEIHFHIVRDYGLEIQNRIFRDVRWVAPAELPSYDFLEADAGLVRDLAAGRILPTG